MKRLTFLVVACLLLAVAPARALDNGLALTPPMGWNHWYAHYWRITDSLVREAADIMVATGMADAVVGLTPGDDVPDAFEVRAVLLESSLRLIAGRGARVHHGDEIASLVADLRALVERA